YWWQFSKSSGNDCGPVNALQARRLQRERSMDLIETNLRRALIARKLVPAARRKQAKCTLAAVSWEDVFESLETGNMKARARALGGGPGTRAWIDHPHPNTEVYA